MLTKRKDSDFFYKKEKLKRNNYFKEDENSWSNNNQIPILKDSTKIEKSLNFPNYETNYNLSRQKIRTKNKQNIKHINFELKKDDINMFTIKSNTRPRDTMEIQLDPISIKSTLNSIIQIILAFEFVD